MNDSFRTIFLGTPEFAVPVLQALHRNAEVVLVLTQPDRRVGRGCRLCKPAVKEAAEELGLEVLQPPIVKGKRFASRIAEYRPDFIVTAAFGRILGTSLLEVPRRAALNVHASLLPRHRGAAPANWAILSGDEQTGVSIMQMAPELDAGPVYLQRRTPVEPGETACDLLARLALLGAEALTEVIRRFEELTPEAQDHSRATYARMLTKDDGRVDWTRDAAQIERQIRGLYPWPSTFTVLGEQTVKIHGARAVPAEKDDGPPGTVCHVSTRGIEVACGEGRLRITELQAPGRKRLDAACFLAGTPLEPGSRFDY